AHFTPTCGPRWSSNSIAPRTHGGHMDRIDRRGFLECMAWVGTGLVWTATGGVLSSRLITEASASAAAAGSFNFVQISDTHIGFKGEANKDAAATLQQVVDRVNALRLAPAFVLHTGDQTHGQKAGAFDTVAEILKGVKTERIFDVPGEHDVFLDGGKEYLARYGKGTEVLLATVEQHVMLAGHIEDALGLHALEDFRDGVEGPGLLTVRLIARVQDEGGRRPQRVDAVDDLLQRRRRILVGFALEADVSVADLDEVEAARSGG